MKRYLFTLAGLLFLATLIVLGVASGGLAQPAVAAPVVTEAAPTLVPHPVLSDVRVRRAIAYCTDKDALLVKFLAAFDPPITLSPEERQALIMDTFVLTSSWAYTPPATTYPYSPTLGRDLLEDAGWMLPGGATFRTKGGRELYVTVSTTPYAVRVALLTEWETQMEACGIHVRSNQVDAAWWFGWSGDVTGLRARDFEAGEFAWVTGSDPGGAELFACDQIPSPDGGWAGQNHNGWCNSAASDAIITATNASLSQAVRKAAYATVIDEYAHDVPSLPLFVRTGGTPENSAWEHIDFNLETYLQSTAVAPDVTAVVSTTDFSGNLSSITIPAGALTEAIVMGYRPLVGVTSPPEDRAVVTAFRLEAVLNGVPQEGWHGSEPITATVRYGDDDLGAIWDEDSLALYVWNGSWQPGSTCPADARYMHLDTATNEITVRLCHLSEFALMGTRTRYVYLPLTLR